jgi:hypothetical protein
MTEDEIESMDAAEPEQGPLVGEEAGQSRDDDSAERDDTGAGGGSGAEGRAPGRRGCLWWLGVTGAVLVVLLVVVGSAGVVLYNFGTMEPPAADIQAEYDRLVVNGQVPQVRSPGFRIPIPGCRCHAADLDIGSKIPGRQPDVTIVMAHRYLTISECGSCHGDEKEPAGIEGQPLEDSQPQ